MILSLAGCLLLQLVGSMPARKFPVLLAHYMPWFENKAVHGSWGWHWTMNKTDADNGALASHYHPLIGAYDSGDRQAVECEVLQMKFSGIDGVLVDWYGDRDRYDYVDNDKHTQLMFEVIRRARMKFALVYEDGTVKNLIEGKVFAQANAVSEGVKLMARTAARWFGQPEYVRMDGKPLLLVFGPRYYQPDDWRQMFRGLLTQPAFFTVHHRQDPAVGAFDWPLPQGGTDACLKATEAFYQRAHAEQGFIPAAYPRFNDFYKEAGVGESYGRVEDRDGKTYSETLTRALDSGAPIVQLVTWNDWGEGTVIEPSREFGYRDLETTQRLRASRTGYAGFAAADLRLPADLYRRQKASSDPATQANLEQVSNLLFAGRCAEARRKLAATR